jgi:pentachlorophenol monooxygenase/3-(3-hydroxy-phenyl)propionate hydroxylase
VCTLDAARVSELDPSGELAETLGLHPGEAWVLRPDAHIAAIVDAADPEAVRSAEARAVGLTT